MLPILNNFLGGMIAGNPRKEIEEKAGKPVASEKIQSDSNK
jgi:hypothetical protein